MPKMIYERNQNILIFIFALTMTVGLILIHSNKQCARAFAEGDNKRGAETPTPTRTATPISFDVGYGRCFAKKKVIQAWLAKATGNPSMNYVCGKLQIATDYKTEKDVLILEPCEKGSYYIFKIRPDELHDYYQFMNVQFQSGEKIFTEEYGVLSKYIRNFSGYYVLENCQGCGIKPVFISTAEVIFPTSTGVTAQSTIYPTLPPFPTQAEILPLSTPTPAPRGSMTSSIPSSISPTISASPPPIQTNQTAAATMAVYLTLMDLKIEPEEPTQNQEVKLHITIQNLGFPTGKPAWDYSSKVVLKSPDGKVLEEAEFSDDQSSSIQDVKSIRVQAETWEITIPLHFRQPVHNGKVEVFVQPLDYMTYIYPRSVKANITIRPEAATTTPTVSSTSHAVTQPDITQTEPVSSKPNICLDLNAALLIPAVAIFILKKRTRRIP